MISIVKRSNKFPTETYPCDDMRQAHEVLAETREMLVKFGTVVTAEGSDRIAFRSQHGTTWEFTITEGEAA
jgi:hypothetical protein